MKVSIAFVLGLAAATLGGCGASAAEIKTAKTAEYKLPPQSMLDIATQVAQIDYKLLAGSVDVVNGTFSTEPQWYHADGGRISAYNEGTGDYVNAHGGDVQVWFVVEVRQISDNYVAVDVQPKTLQLIAGSPQPRELQTDDPNLPPWIHGRVDELALKIYDSAKQYAIKDQPDAPAR
ncbi:MAG TPA: hypothetical protein VGM90_31715 [Kofleriaceae bacterium]|jgi:hypothetical protein